MYKEIKKPKVEETPKLTKKQKRTMVKRLSILVLVLILLVVAVIFGVNTYSKYEAEQNKITMQLNGQEEIKLEYGKEYNDEGATAIYKETDISYAIEVANNIDINKIGQYEVKYSVKVGKWTNEIKRKIIVEDKKIPFLELKGSKDMFVKLGTEYKEPGYTAEDEYDGDLTSNVEVEGTVDTNKKGEYTIVYTVRDSSQNTSSETRTVRVAEDDSTITAGSDVVINRVEQTYEVDPNKIVYVGDSTTLHLGYHAIVAYGQVWNKPSVDPNTINLWSINIGQNDSGLTVRQLAEKYKPKKMVVTLGSNGASWMKEDYLVGRYTEFIKSIKETSPETVVAVQSIFPVTADYDSQNKGLNNENIDKMNNAIKDMCKELGIKYIDTNSKLKGSDGKLKVEYSNGDGVHLNATGCQIVVNTVTSHLG